MWVNLWNLGGLPPQSTNIYMLQIISTHGPCLHVSTKKRQRENDRERERKRHKQLSTYTV